MTTKKKKLLRMGGQGKFWGGGLKSEGGKGPSIMGPIVLKIDGGGEVNQGEDL